MSLAASSRLATNPRLTSTRSSRSRAGRIFWIIMNAEVDGWEKNRCARFGTGMLSLRGLEFFVTEGKRLNPFLAILFLHQDLHLPFGVLQHLKASLRQSDALLENFQRVVEREVTLLQFSDD